MQVGPKEELSKELVKIQDFMSLDFDPNTGKISLLANFQGQGKFPNKIEVIKKIVLEVLFDVAKGAFVGFVIGGVFGVGAEAYELCKTIKAAKTLAAVGGVLGGVYGVQKSWQYTIDLKTLQPQVQGSIGKTKLIIDALIDFEVQAEFISSDDSWDEILCPISGNVMVIPVITSCQHVFDFVNLAGWLAAKGKTCPTCRGAVDLSSVLVHKERTDSITNIARNVFRSLEDVLGKRDVYEIETVSRIAEKVRLGNTLLDDDIEMLRKKIHLKTFSEEEAYTMSYYILHQFKPLQNKRDTVYRLSKRALDLLLQDKGIDRKFYQGEMENLKQWYNVENLLPKNQYPLLRKLL